MMRIALLAHAPVLALLFKDKLFLLIDAPLFLPDAFGTYLEWILIAIILVVIVKATVAYFTV